MFANAKKSEEKRSSAVAHPICQNKSGGKQEGWLMDNRRGVVAQRRHQEIISFDTKFHRVNSNFLIIQRTLEQAIESAKQMGFSDINSREGIIKTLSKQPKPNQGEGVDVIRMKFNEGNLMNRIVYADIWPDPEPKERTDAKRWVKEFISNKNIKGLPTSNNLGNIEKIIKMKKSRVGTGLDLLNKFVFYNLYGKEILQHLFDNYSYAYAEALNSEFSSQLNVNAGTPVNDELFKDIPFDSDIDSIRSVGIELFESVFKEGLENLLKSIKEGYSYEIITEHYFMHDKGYRNALTPLTKSLAQKYKTRLDGANEQALKEREQGWKNVRGKNQYDHTNILLGRKSLDRNVGV